MRSIPRPGASRLANQARRRTNTARPAASHRAEAMTADQAERLHILSSEAGEAFNPSLTRAEADRRIRDLQRRPGHRP